MRIEGVTCDGFVIKPRTRSALDDWDAIQASVPGLSRIVGRPTQRSATLSWYELSTGEPLPPGDAFALAREIEALPAIDAAEPVFDSEEPRFPNDLDEDVEIRGPAIFSGGGSGVDPATDGRYDWHFRQIRAEQAWIYSGTRGSGVRVGHIDVGYTEHPEFFASNRILTSEGYNFEENNPNAMEPLATIGKGHGSATGSILLSPPGRQMDDTGDVAVFGIAPDIELVPIRCDKNVWFLSGKNDAYSIDYAVNKGCHVLSMSRGGSGGRILRDAVKNAYLEGRIIVAAANNCHMGCGYITEPAIFPETICAAGSTFNREPWRGSSNGAAVDMSAPAFSLYRARSERDDIDYRYSIARSNGTSYATAQIAAAAAIWLSYRGGTDVLKATYGEAHLVVEAFRFALVKYGFDPGQNWNEDRYGPGILNIEKLLKGPMPTKMQLSAADFASRKAVDEGATFLQQLVSDEMTRKKVEAEIAFFARADVATATIVNDALKTLGDPELTVDYQRSVTERILELPISIELRAELERRVT